MTLNFEEPFVGRLPQPKPKGHGPPDQIIRQALVSFQMRFLDDVGWIDPSAQFAVQTKFNRPAQRFAMPAKQFVKSATIPPMSLQEQGLRL
jgi:hypothetical protein